VIYAQNIICSTIVLDLIFSYAAAMGENLLWG